ncbi:ldlrap1 [Pungitius sinensis]
MDALRSAGRALVRSPALAKQSWTAGRHRKLPEIWTDTRETIAEGMTFHLRHLGMTLVERPKGEELSAAAVKRIVATAKASGKKPQRVALKVSFRGIVLHDSATHQLLENVSIHRISYCTVDALHDKVFAYIAQNALSGTLECHAYLCPKRKVARAVALTVAQAFTVAFERWQVAMEDVATDRLLDFGDGANVVAESNGNVEEDQRPPETDNNPPCEAEDALDEAFSRLAASRTNPQVLDIGVTPQEWLSEPD